MKCLSVRNRILCALVCLFVTLVLARPALGATNFVVMTQNKRFNPAVITNNVGDTVTWIARGEEHDTVSEDGVWSSGIMAVNATFSFTFTTPGTYKYFCTPHRDDGMTGTIIVLGAANTPPTVTITSPAAGATFPATNPVNITADATDTGSVTSVEFFANGTLVGTDASSPFAVSATLTAGSYALTARATDNEGASTTSAAVNIQVNAANPPPSVAITAPSAGATFTTFDQVTFTASATDNGRVTRVEFFANGNSIGSTTSSPFGIVTTLAAGSYSVTARATDNLGASTTSAAVNIIVNAPQVNLPPTVTLSSEPAVLLIAAGESLKLKGTATDSDGTVTQVEFFRGSDSVGVDTTSPYEVTLSNVSAGIHNFTLVATDNIGANTTSTALQIRAAARPTIDSITRDSTGTSIQVTGTTGIAQTLEGSRDFQAWNEAGTATPVDSKATFSDKGTESSRYYRVVVR